MALKTMLNLLVIVLTLSLPNLSAATLPEATDLRQRLQNLQSDPQANSEAIKQLELAQQALNDYQRWQSQQSELQQQIAQAAKIKQQRQQQIDKLVAAKPPALNNDLADAELDKLLDDAKVIGNQLAAEIANQNEQRQQLLRLQQNLPQQIAEIEQSLKQLQQTEPQQSDNLSQQWYRQIVFSEQQAHLQLLQLQQRTLLPRLDLSKLYLQLLDLQQQQNQTKTQLISERLLQLNQLSGQQMIARAARLVADVQTQQLQQTDSSVTALTTSVTDLAKQFESLGIETAKAQQERQRLQQIRQQTSHTLAQLKEQITWLQQSPEFSDAIRGQLKRLPLVDNYRDYQTELAQAHLQRFTLSQHQGNHYSASDPQNRPLNKLADFEQELTDQLLSEYDQYIAILTELNGLQTQVIQEVAAEKDFLREKQLLLQGQAPLWQVLPQRWHEFFGNASSSARWQFIKDTFAGRHLALAIWLLVTVVSLISYWHFSRVLKHWQQQFASSLGNAKTDRYGRTLSLTVAITALVFLPVLPLLLIFIYSSIHAPYFTSFDQYHLLIATMVQIYLWEWLLQASRQQGLFVGHFEFSLVGCQSLRRLLKRFRPLFYCFTIGILIVEAWAADAESSALRLMLIGVTAILFGFYWRLLSTPAILALISESKPTLLSKILLMAIELILVVAIALICAGYFYAAWALIYYLHAGLLVVLLVLLLRQLGFRWLRVEESHRAYQLALQKRAEQQGDEEAANQELTSMAKVEQLSKQSLMVLNLISLIALFALGSALLANTELALQWMDNIVVWEVSSGEGASAITEKITLRAAINALVLVSICFFAAANLPGVLELLVLHHLPMSKGVSYAITTLLRYALVMVALGVGLSALGLHWSNLQWLVAALGVGLGFGLQEIFANLVCGLILLVERPVRVGDIITINELTGTVTRINTRATTIQDWDRKEILVPNKALITDQLTNWSLSDGITRIVIPIGVAYGSDVPLVKRILLEIADEHSDVLSEPSPLALFSSFGDSALMFELRCYIETPDTLASTRDQLNSNIDARFREHQIDIAFPQLDINIKTGTNPPDLLLR
ncbi:mechanosensitive ion channel domain-containing protein [Ferrimonas senticii]|uniref:mechanosensitive ion channel domain-containing protein n=1 Tax=Ferrimonas senticii TaxID=394566 RepID=UPI00040FB127|nr:mechanosensitive ion channel domain-containing protein [Ferrimonas senticii]